MSQRWNYQVIEVKPGFATWTGRITAEAIQTELNKQGALGWELVQVLDTGQACIRRS